MLGMLVFTTTSTALAVLASITAAGWLRVVLMIVTIGVALVGGWLLSGAVGRLAERRHEARLAALRGEVSRLRVELSRVEATRD